MPTVASFTIPVFHFDDSSGNPLVGGKLYSYAAGTTTLQTTYQDAAGTTPNTNPIILNARGEAVIYMVASQIYKLVLEDSVGNVIWTEDNINPITPYSALNASSGSSLVGFTQGVAGAIGTTVQSKLRETVSVKDFGAVGDGVTDDTAAINVAFTQLKATGGTLLFPKGEYAFYLDVSGSYPLIIFKGEGSTFRPVSLTQTNSAIIYANNSTGLGTGASVNIEFHNITFSGRLHGSVDPNYGDINYPVYFRSAWSKFFGCTFQYARIAGFYALYGQYNQFYECAFAANIYSGTAIGCFLDSNTVSESANENSFFRCIFNTNSTGLRIHGGIANRAYGCEFQNNTVAGLDMGADGTGYGADQSIFSGCYFEINGNDVTLGVASRPTFIGCAFLPGKITTTNCYEPRFIENTFYGGTPVLSFNHPAGNGNIASLVWRDNNITPTVSQLAGLVHAAPTYLDIKTPETGQKYVDTTYSLLNSTNAPGLNNIAIQDWSGVKNAVSKGVATNIFTLTQLTSANLPARVSVFTVELFTWDDTNSGSQFGYSGHIQRFAVMVSNNTTGAPQVNIVSEGNGYDVGISTAFQAPGPVTLTSSVAGDIITFIATWSGTGTGASGMTQQAISYNIRGSGTNGLYLTHL